MMKEHAMEQNLDRFESNPKPEPGTRSPTPFLIMNVMVTASMISVYAMSNPVVKTVVEPAPKPQVVHVTDAELIKRLETLNSAENLFSRRMKEYRDFVSVENKKLDERELQLLLKVKRQKKESMKDVSEAMNELNLKSREWNNDK